jgi:DNA-binding XRE family transcriptional regulator
MTISYKEDLKRRLKDPEFKKEYNALKNEFIIIQALIDARKKHDYTQKELSDRCGIDQADISRIERGLANPTLKLLQKLADGLDMDLELRFVPKSK